MRDGCVGIKCKRGIKQADLMSPSIFNCVINPIISEIERIGMGLEVEGKKLPILAFAEDLVELVKDAEEANKIVRIIIDWLTNLGMNLFPSKSVCFRIRKTSDSWSLNDPQIDEKA